MEVMLLREGPLARSLMSADAVRDAYEAMRARLERGEEVPVTTGVGGPATHAVDSVRLHHDEEMGRLELRAKVRPR